MLANIVLLFITLLILYFVGMLWLRQNLIAELRELQHREDVLMKDFQKRRDQVPLLLESIRELQEPSDAWRKLVTDRAACQGTRAAEETFEKELLDFLSHTSLRSVNFLEVQKSIEEISALIERQKQEIRTAATEFNTKRKEFPYALASAIFHFREETAA
jgi:hypothetical protein